MLEKNSYSFHLPLLLIGVLGRISRAKENCIPTLNIIIALDVVVFTLFRRKIFSTTIPSLGALFVNFDDGISLTPGDRINPKNPLLYAKRRRHKTAKQRASLPHRRDTMHNNELKNGENLKQFQLFWILIKRIWCEDGGGGRRWARS